MRTSNKIVFNTISVLLYTERNMLPDVTEDGIADSLCNVLTFILKGKYTVSTDLIKPQLQPFFIENQQS